SFIKNMKFTFLYKSPLYGRPVRSKLLMVMKLTSILLLFCAMHVSAAGYSQQISISKKETNLKEVFAEIKNQSGYTVFYSDRVDPSSHALDVQFKNLPLREALDRCLSGQGLTYTIVNKTIVVKT